jgi:hypothetical protein
MRRGWTSLVAFMVLGGAVLGGGLGSGPSSQVVGQNCFFSWTNPTVPDLVGVRLYKKQAATDPYTTTPAADVLAPGNTVSCANAGITTPGSYWAVARSYNTSGNESPDSNEVAFTITP